MQKSTEHNVRRYLCLQDPRSGGRLLLLSQATNFQNVAKLDSDLQSIKNDAERRAKHDWLGYRAGQRLEARQIGDVFTDGKAIRVRQDVMQRWLSEGIDEQPYHALASIGRSTISKGNAEGTKST